MKTAARFYRNQVLLCLASLPMSAAIGAVCAVFGIVLTKVIEFRGQYLLRVLPFFGVAGALIVWYYGRFGKASAKGMALFFEAHEDARTDIPLRLAPMVMAGTWLTHLFGGSAGREGAAVQIGGTIGRFVGQKLKIPEGNKILMISGMAAGFGGLFRTPVAAVFFSLEVFRRGSVEYAALLPALVSAYTASFVSGLMGIEKFSFSLSYNEALSFLPAIKLIALGVVFGLIGMLFSVLLKKLKAVLPGMIKNPVLRALVCGTALGLLSVVCYRGRYAGLGENLISDALAGNALPLDFALKLLFTAATLAVGYTGGEFTPLFSIGASAGCVLAAAVGLPAGLGAAAGYVGVFAAATNTYLAPVFIGAEVFGARYIPIFAVVCAVSSVFNWSKSVYSLQKSNLMPDLDKAHR